jgi:hypothetical protein
MAARRLLIVMLVLLGISTLAAALIPPQSLRENATSTATTTTATLPTATAPPQAPSGRSLGFKFKVDGRRVKVVQAEVGDQLRLQISSTRFGQLEVPAFGLVDTVGPDQPALFDLLVDRPGTIGIYYVGTNRLAAQIQVRKALATKAGAARGKGSKPGKGKP